MGNKESEKSERKKSEEDEGRLTELTVNLWGANMESDCMDRKWTRVKKREGSIKKLNARSAWTIE